MPQKRIAMHPNFTGGKIKHLRVGPVWTEIELILKTDRLQVQTTRQKKKK
jgi:hypothetical protein